MIEHNIFSKDANREIGKADAQMRQYPYFENSGSWCRELLLERQNVPAVMDVLKLGMEYADLVGVERDLVPLVYISRMLPDAVNRLKRLGFSDLVIEDSFRDLEIWMEVYRTYHNGRCGLERVEWVLRSVAGLVYRLGDFQFEKVTYEFPYHIYKNQRTEEYRALTVPGLRVDQDGYLAGTNGRPCHCWRETELSIEPGKATGNGVNLNMGTIDMERSVSLNFREWKLVLAPGMKALALHIPAGADLSERTLKESLAMAKTCFRKESVLNQSLVLCDSWLLDPHLTQLLPEEGKICSFMKKFYKLPVMETVPQIYERVMGFDFKQEEMESYHAVTSLQKNLQKYVLGGGEVFTTAGFLVNSFD